MMKWCLESLDRWYDGNRNEYDIFENEHWFHTSSYYDYVVYSNLMMKSIRNPSISISLYYSHRFLNLNSLKYTIHRWFLYNNQAVHLLQ